MPARKQGGRVRSQKTHLKTPEAAEKKFGKAARSAAERGGKKPVIWQQAERPAKRLPGSIPLAPKADIFEKPAKTFESTASRTIEASASELFRAFNDPRRRMWCHERGYAVRGSLAPRSLTLGIADGSLGVVSIQRKGNTRCQVAVLQKGITTESAAEKARGEWRASLERLAGMMAE